MIDDFKKDTDENKVYDFENAIEIIGKIEIYLKDNSTKYTEDEIDTLIDRMILIYKKKVKDKEFADEPSKLELFYNSLNFLFISLGYFPITKTGDYMDEGEAKQFIENVYKKRK